MSVISLTITQSADQTVPGIPNLITLSSNIPAIIFYSLDGSTPNTTSSIYTYPIRLPIYLQILTLKVFATDGTNNSAIITQTFTADLSKVLNTTVGARTAQATVAFTGNPANGNSLYPFGNSNPTDNAKYTGIGNPDNTLLNESEPSQPNAFDQNGNPASYTNRPLDPFGSPPRPEDKNVRLIGKNGPTEYVQEFSSSTDKLFNPKALVIYHDAENLDPLSPVIINRPHFSLENPEAVKDGVLLSTVGLDTPTITGSFIHNHYNPNTGEMTSYYRDSQVNRWIISTWKYSGNKQSAAPFSQVVFGRQEGSQFVFPWTLWGRRTLG